MHPPSSTTASSTLCLHAPGSAPVPVASVNETMPASTPGLVLSLLMLAAKAGKHISIMPWVALCVPASASASSLGLCVHFEWVCLCRLGPCLRENMCPCLHLIRAFMCAVAVTATVHHDHHPTTNSTVVPYSLRVPTTSANTSTNASFKDQLAINGNPAPHSNQHGMVRHC